MKVSGFTIIRNGVEFEYPFIESIKSVLPLCDEMIVAVGNSTDNTLEMVKAIDSPKIRIIQTVWDDTLREGGRVLAVETDKAKAAISKDSDWGIYIQADEVLHEQDYPEIRRDGRKPERPKGGRAVVRSSELLRLIRLYSRFAPLDI